MSTGTSSLRQTERRRGVCASACAATLALALAGPSFAASAPAPDNPPTGPRSEASPRIASAPVEGSTLAERATRAAATGASSPTPDAPVTAHTAVKPTADAHPAATKVVVTTPAPTATSTAPVQSQTSPATPASAATSEQRAAAPTPKRRAARPAPSEKRSAAPAPRVAAVPRDGTRLGLPIGTLTLSSVPAGGGQGALLAAAALLLVAAAAGGLVVGVAGRRLARIT